MQTKTDAMTEIHESLVNGQRRQMFHQINSYGLYDFWEDYKEYLAEIYVQDSSGYDYFTDATISYFRICTR